MKLLAILLSLFICSVAFPQEKEFYIQGKVIDGDAKPVGDVYILNYRNQDKAVSRQNGIFDMMVLPSDSLMVSHVSYMSKRITVFDLMMEPIVRIELDTVNIMEVNVYSDPQDDYENARKNIESMGFNPKPKPDDKFTEKEMVQDMAARENKVMRAEANSLRILKLSPSDVIEGINRKRKRHKKAKRYPPEKN